MKKLILLFIATFFSQFSWGLSTSELDIKEDKEQLSISERKHSLQLSPEKLKQMTTRELLEECLNYPYIIDLLFYTDIQEGFDSLFVEFNGFKELLYRKDIEECLLTRIENLPKEFSHISDSDNISKGKFSFKSIVLEMLMLKDLNFKMNREIAGRLLKSVDACMTLKMAHPDIFGSISINSTHNIKRKLTTGLMRMFITPTAATIHTPMGSVVPDTYYITGDDYNFTSAELDALANELFTNYDGAEIVGVPTNRYNCHGYAWHVSEGGGNLWIGYNTSTAENIYWTDGSYIEVPESEATKISYDESTANHSAVRINSSWYQSKWGAGPLVKHHPNACPYNTSNPKKYYKRNLSILGSTTFYNNSTFSLNNYMSGATVHWSISGYYSNYFSIENNTPDTNMCRVSIIDTQNFPGGNVTLTANVMYGGAIIESVSKVINGVGIFGDIVPCGYECYYVNPRPDNTTVEWTTNGKHFVSISDSVPTVFQPSEPDSYIIANTEHRNIYGTLTATVKSGENVIAVLERVIDTSGGLTGTWYQEATTSDTINSTPKTFSTHSNLNLIPNRRVYLESDMFDGASITYQTSGYFITESSFSNNVISFMPNSLAAHFNSGGSVIINGTYPNSCQRFGIHLYTLGPIIDPINPLLVNSFRNSFEFSLDKSALRQMGLGEDSKWQLTIQDDNGSKIYAAPISNGNKHVNTSGWKKGLYIATAIIADKQYSVKICVTR